MQRDVPQPESAAASVEEEARRPGRRAQMFSALAHRDFRLLLAGNLATQLGQWTQQVGKGWLVYELTGSPAQLGLVVFFQGIAMFVFSPIGGGLADRFNRRTVMMATQTGMMVVALLLAFLVLMDRIAIWQVYVLALASGAGFALNGPSRQSAVFELVGHRNLNNAIALNSLSMNSMRIVGPSIGGFLLGTVGTEGTFFVQAAGYVVALSTLIMMQHKFSARQAAAPFVQSLVHGIRYARSSNVIAPLLAIAFVSAIFGMSFIHLLAAYAGDVLGLDGGGFAYLFVVAGAGGVVGALGVAALGNFDHGGKLLMGSLLATGLLLILLGAGTLPMAIMALTGLGMSGAVTLAMANTLLQTHVQDDYRGRVMSLYHLSFGLAPIGTLAGGIMAEFVGLQIAMVVLGLAVITAILAIGTVSPRVREL